ncbi:hypothetical protein ACQPXH_17495 [Nocardia sp. CA-135953]|uniref:hypothetical protein n=1 Tax=Nocardia sp. CA-135953 TaxID=3239978 RepID=UPI003D98782E
MTAAGYRRGMPAEQIIRRIMEAMGKARHSEQYTLRPDLERPPLLGCLVGWAFDEFALGERGSGADERDRVSALTAPAGLAAWISSKQHG